MDSNESYSRKIIVQNSSEATYKALTTDIGKWWVAPEGKSEEVGDTPIFRFGPTYWKMKVKNLIPSELVVWVCIEAKHVDKRAVGDVEREWVGTVLEWKINEIPEGTKIHFIHKGLTPSLNCYKICREGWNYFFAESLKKYLDSGKGDPFQDSRKKI